MKFFLTPSLRWGYGGTMSWANHHWSLTGSVATTGWWREGRLLLATRLSHLLQLADRFPCKARHCVGRLRIHISSTKHAAEKRSATQFICCRRKVIFASLLVFCIRSRGKRWIFLFDPLSNYSSVGTMEWKTSQRSLPHMLFGEATSRCKPFNASSPCKEQGTKRERTAAKVHLQVILVGVKLLLCTVNQSSRAATHPIPWGSLEVLAFSQWCTGLWGHAKEEVRAVLDALPYSCWLT